MKKIFIILLSLFNISNYANATIETIKIKRKDSSFITAYLKHHDHSKNYSIIINIGGSLCQSEFDNSPINENYLKYNFATLKVEKYGIDSNQSHCGLLYRKKNNINQRASDISKVLEYLETKKTGWNKKAFIIAGSEGTVVAPLLTRKSKRIKAIALWAGARSMKMEDEFLINIKNGHNLCSDTEFNANAYLYQFAKIKKNKSSTKLWCSTSAEKSINSYQWWNHILFYNPLADFIDFSGNIYVAHGTDDKMIPIESSENTANVFKKMGKNNLKLIKYDGLDHQCANKAGESHCDKVFSQMYHWLLKEVEHSNESK